MKYKINDRVRVSRLGSDYDVTVVGINDTPDGVEYETEDTGGTRRWSMEEDILGPATGKPPRFSR